MQVFKAREVLLKADKDGEVVKAKAVIKGAGL